MSRGKEIGQAVHAFRFIEPVPLRLVCGETPIVCVRADSELALREIIAEAILNGAHVSTVHDAGHTHNPPGTLTCAAIGPVLGERGPLLTAARLY